jgi:hypothetical protein
MSEEEARRHLGEAREAMLAAASRLPASSPWKDACREIAVELSGSLGEQRLRLVPDSTPDGPRLAPLRPNGHNA